MKLQRSLQFPANGKAILVTLKRQLLANDPNVPQLNAVRLLQLGVKVTMKATTEHVLRRTSHLLQKQLRKRKHHLVSSLRYYLNLFHIKYIIFNFQLASSTRQFVFQ